MAVTDFNDGQTHTINSQINDDVQVDYQTPGTQTTVNLVTGGIISGGLSGYGDSRVNVTGGSVGGVAAYDNSRVVMSGGTTGSLIANGGQISMFGGSSGVVVAANGGQITIDNGQTGDLHTVGGYNQISVSGGLTGNIDAYNGSFNQVTISGGRTGDLSIDWYGNLTISGGSAGNLMPGSLNQITICGGSVSSLHLQESSYHNNVEWSGGVIQNDILLGLFTGGNGSIFNYLTINGYDFAIDGVPIKGSPFGTTGHCEITTSSNRDDQSYRLLTGTLANGDVINNQFKIGVYSAIYLNEVPEPATISILVIGLLFLRRKK